MKKRFKDTRLSFASANGMSDEELDRTLNDWLQQEVEK